MRPKLIVIGASLGGLDIFKELLPGLPATFRTPIAIAQHRVADSDSKLRHVLQRYASLPIVEPEDKTPIAEGAIYLAPPDYHLLVDAEHFHLSTEAPLRYARPSIDILFETAADYFAKDLVALVLTGASDDGARGAKIIASRGGRVLVQDPASAHSPVMPSATLAAVPRAEAMSVAELSTTLVALG